MKITPPNCLAYAVLGFITPVSGFISSGPSITAPSTAHRGIARSTNSGHRAAAAAALGSRRLHQQSPLFMVAAPERQAADVDATPGSADLDWMNLGFEYRDVNGHVKFTFKDGRWDEGEIVTDPYVKVHIANTALHYGQSVFEGLKAFHSKDGRYIHVSSLSSMAGCGRSSSDV